MCVCVRLDVHVRVCARVYKFKRLCMWAYVYIIDGTTSTSAWLPRYINPTFCYCTQLNSSTYME